MQLGKEGERGDERGEEGPAGLFAEEDERVAARKVNERSEGRGKDARVEEAETAVEALEEDGSGREVLREEDL